MIAVVIVILTRFCSCSFHSKTSDVTSDEGKHPPKKTSLQAALADGMASVFGSGKTEEEKKEKDEKQRFSLASVDNLLPKIRRGFVNEEQKEEDAMVVGWKSEVRSRKDREEVLR